MDLVFVNLVYIHLVCADLVNGDLICVDIVYVDLVCVDLQDALLHTLIDFDWLMVSTSLYLNSDFRSDFIKM